MSDHADDGGVQSFRRGQDRTARVKSANYNAMSRV